jgi:mRNA-degrading endonuclease RelE of RelBE toxin-antitoxin system
MAAADVARVSAAIDEMHESPLVGDVKRLHGEPAEWRRRVGSWRIRFILDSAHRHVRIIAIVRRTSTTY